MFSKREKGGRYMISKKGEKRPQLPSGEPLIVVDLNSRKIDTAKQLALPQFHNMQADICAETIYFIMDRYFDGQDLAHFESVAGYNPSNQPTEEQNEIFEEIPAGRPGSVNEVSDLALHLAQSPLYLTGQVITIDGGWT